MALSLSAVTATAAHAAVPFQAGPFWPGNMLSMDNADFENGPGDWQVPSNGNVSSLTTDSTAFLHNSALKIVAAGSGTSTIQLSGTSGIQISLPDPGGTYRVGAYVKMPATANHTTEFDLGCYDSSGGWLGWAPSTQVSNNSSGAWQWVEDNITVPSGCDHVQGSPQVKFTGMNSGGTIHMDEVWFAPHRAALMIGAYAPSVSDWFNDNMNGCSTCIAPLQSDKVFWSDNQDFQGWKADPNNQCYGIEQQYTNDHSKWPVCLIAFKDQENYTQIYNFLQNMPSDQTVIFIYHQEPEGDSFPTGSGSCDPGAQYASQEFICEFEQEATTIRNAANNLGKTENVFIADDSSSGQYDTPDSDDGNGDAGMLQTPNACSWIVPPSQTDFYFVDHYERGWANDSNLHQQTGSSESGYDGDGTEQWNNWLDCINNSDTTLPKPIGVAEYGLCSGGMGTPICGQADYPSCGNQTPPAGETSLDTQAMQADHSYLANEPWGTSPTLLWEYWYYKCWQFSDSGGITEWQTNIENQNGGAVGG